MQKQQEEDDIDIDIDDDDIVTVKVVMLGESGVGKSSLAQRFVLNTFTPYTESTIGASFLSKSIENIKFHIWDTAGQEKYHSLAPLYYRGASAAIVVYDICNPVSFVTVQRWVNELKANKTTGHGEIVLALCGNKSDLSDHRRVDMQEAREYAESIGAFYLETSARDSVNVQQLFIELAKRVPKSYSSETSQRTNHTNTAQPNIDLHFQHDPPIAHNQCAC